MPPSDVTVRYLEMTSPGQLAAKRVVREGLRFVRLAATAAAVNRYCYYVVGGSWFWTDRRLWSDGEWEAWAATPNVETWILASGDSIAGYCELERLGSDAEIKYFGLVPGFIGQGLGAHLLTEVVERAWATGASRIVLNTCSLDHPRALANYQARGFREFRVEVQHRDVPDRPPAAWVGPVPVLSSSFSKE